MTSTETEELEELTAIYKALGNQARITVLLHIYNGNPVSELTEELDMSRSGLQKHVEQLIDTNLLYRPVDSQKTYDTTTLGQFFIKEINDNKEDVDKILNNYQAQLQTLKEDQEETLHHMQEAGISTQELENKLSAEAWKEINQD